MKLRLRRWMLLILVLAILLAGARDVYQHTTILAKGRVCFMMVRYQLVQLFFLIRI